MVIRKMSSLLLAAVLAHACAWAQKPATKKTMAKERGPEAFPQLITAPIPGAPVLGQPQLIMGGSKPVLAEGMGWASPLVMDWDGDGKKDLLIGEFGSGLENKNSVGNFMRVYKNKGTDDQPVFSDQFNYAYGYSELSNGTPMSVYTWCCMAFTPRVADLDNDGYDDILTGQFEPGNVSWFRGSPKGFLPAQKLDQSGDPLKLIVNIADYTKDPTDITGHPYWMYSAVAFGDFDKDGDQDMVVGGSCLRISENKGTKNEPLFGVRKRLLDVNEKPLKIYRDSHVKFDRLYDSLGMNAEKPDSGSGVCVPYVVDWDNDGMLDIMVTEAYASEGDAVITFFRGRKTEKGMRFEPGIPLITAKNNEKAFPGSTPNVCVTDWNNDGIKDLVIGINIATVNDKFYPIISWDWEEKHDTYKKSPKYYNDSFLEIINKQLASEKKFQDSTKMTPEQLNKGGHPNYEESFKHYFVKEEYKTLAHKGYVYVLLGKAGEPLKAQQK